MLRTAPCEVLDIPPPAMGKLNHSCVPDAVPPPVDAERFRGAMRRLAAGVSVLTTVDGCGVPLGLTVTSVASVSLEPPLLLVCVDHRSRTLGPLGEGRPFVVQFLAAGQAELARRFATFRPDKFAGVEVRPTASGCPRLAGVLASVECVLYRLVPAGDHVVVVGRVVDVVVGEPGGSPLLYVAGRYLES